ncbi:hypothetical protein SAMN05518849_10610 [Sphingobium sp. AP50]|nr:hypothetical protein SAMN05518849_10610 [Sphingobium sp. AP50]
MTPHYPLPLREGSGVGSERSELPLSYSVFV